jgi:hypothetical protein|tara:strand:+ start:2350 stop:2766 length:417 start_codon:yes stop_codon:yes gene_type:complete
MNIITSNPIISENDFRAEDFENFFGEKARRRRASRKSKRGSKRGSKKGGGFIDKIKGGIDKVKDSGILNSIKGVQDSIKGGGISPTGGGGYDAPIVDPIIPTATTTETGLSKTAKIAIGVGVAAILGLVIYRISRKKK